MTAGAVPAEGMLLELGADDWTIVLGHVRTVLNELEDTSADAPVKRLRSAPTGRLAGGRMRRDLVRLVTTRPGIWASVRDRLAEDGGAGHLAWLVAGEQPPVVERTAASPRESTPARDDRTARRDRRLQEARDERDALRRQLGGAESRASRAEDRADELAAIVADLESEVAQLREDVAAERARTDAAVEREQRRQAAHVAELERDLTTSRRDLDRLRQSRRAAERTRQAAADRRARGEHAAPVEPGSAVLPGRPSRLPPGVRLDTTEGARALLSAVKQVFVDGWNVTMTQWSTLAPEEQRRRLGQALDAAVGRHGLRVTVVWDGRDDGDESLQRGVRQVFTPEGTTADDDLVFRVAALSADEPVVVVTDDAGLRERLAEWQPDVLGAQAFLWALR